MATEIDTLPEAGAAIAVLRDGAAGFAPWANTRKGTWPPGPAFPAVT
jgi:hypothetical protein